MNSLMARCRNRFAACMRSNDGASAIEFALCAPVIFIIILGTIELSLDMFVDASVQLAAQAASRAGLTTENPATGTRAQEAQQIVMDYLGRWKNLGASVTIAEQDFAAYSDVGTSSFTGGLGGLGDVVSYNITVTMPAFTPIPKLLGITTLTFQRNYLVQNEE
jgi:Flp pilus assembly protein TadG